ncbi:hypothetical protein M407DRAFT_23922 [Tulasnella calospora MUT 4182]|uniref:Uncharacterized protein n=1 Tax=Tulasnella calospora MUT 4182 TaxID=1051891 RepID=A0A0C3QKF4_9AGAM|nr:hypothetical protein M407DRAFT_23922 [Tulasnella calospora MUT 4182]
MATQLDHDVTPLRERDFQLNLFDTYRTCHLKLEPHLQWLFQNLNANSWVPQRLVAECSSLMDEWKESMNAAGDDDSALKELVSREGHKRVTDFYGRYLTLRRELENVQTERITQRVMEASALAPLQ